MAAHWSSASVAWYIFEVTVVEPPRRRVAFRDTVETASFEREEAPEDSFEYDGRFSEFGRASQPMGRIRIPVEELLQRSLDNQRLLIDQVAALPARVGELAASTERSIPLLETIASNSAHAVPRVPLAPRAPSGAGPLAYSPTRQSPSFGGQQRAYPAVGPPPRGGIGKNRIFCLRWASRLPVLALVLDAALQQVGGCQDGRNQSSTQNPNVRQAVLLAASRWEPPSGGANE